jgi:hypothetical protein
MTEKQILTLEQWLKNIYMNDAEHDMSALKKND